MKLVGNNLEYGDASIDLSDTRSVLPAMAEGEGFPAGVRGLIPVATRRKSGEVKLTYAFRVGEDDLGPVGVAAPHVPATPERGDESGLDHLDDDCDEDLDDGYDEDFEDDPDEDSGYDADEDPAYGADEDPVDDVRLKSRALLALQEAVDLANDLLEEASDLSRHPFGYIESVQVGIPAEGWGFTRVDLQHIDDEDEGYTILSLRLETVPHPGSENSLSAIIEYDAAGYPLVVNMVEYGVGGAICRINANVNADTGELSVKKVEEADSIGSRSRQIYHRNWRHDPYWRDRL